MGALTRKQHFIPRMILRRHAVPFYSKHIWLYDSEKNVEKMVSLSDACHEKYLYELRGDDGVIIAGYENCIEYILSRWESVWSSVLDKVCDHVVLTKEDCAVLYVLMAVQILRTPDSLAVATKYVQSLDCELSEVVAARIVRAGGLLLTKDMSREMCPFFASVLEHLAEYDLCVFDSEYPLILSSTMPVQMWTLVDGYKKDTVVVFPFSAHQCVVLSKQPYGHFYQRMTARETCLFNYTLLQNSSQQHGNGRYFLGSVKPSRFLKLE